MKKICLFLGIGFLLTIQLQAQGTTTKSVDIPVTKAELGTFPYLKNLPNTYSNDSSTLEQTTVYFYDGKQYFTVEGKASKQKHALKDEKFKYSINQLVSEYTKVISTLGGKKVYEGELPKPALKTIAGTDDIVKLMMEGQLVDDAYYGVVEYVIKTPEKEVWIQLQPYSILSDYYSLLIIEKQYKLISGNINKENNVLKDIETKGVSICDFLFELDKDVLLSESKDELLNLVAIFQAHPTWKLQIDVHNAPLGDEDYTLKLTEKRADALKSELLKLGIGPSNVELKGWGDQKPLDPNKTETSRIKNTRVEIKKV